MRCSIRLASASPRCSARRSKPALMARPPSADLLIARYIQDFGRQRWLRQGSDNRHILLIGVDTDMGEQPHVLCVTSTWLRQTEFRQIFGQHSRCHGPRDFFRQPLFSFHVRSATNRCYCLRGRRFGQRNRKSGRDKCVNEFPFFPIGRHAAPMCCT